MSQADELLNTLGDGEIATYSDESGSEPHIVIGADRFITVPDELKRIAVQYDHDVETVTFDCPRYSDGRDLSGMKIYINGFRADKAPFCFPVDNGVTIDEADDSIIHFDWTITREISEVYGNIIFLVCAKKVDDEGNEDNHWNSELCKDMYVSEGLEVMETIMKKYPDLVTHLLTRMDIVENKTTLESMLGYLDTYFTTDAEINVVLKNYVDEYLGNNEEVTQTIEDFVNTYIEENVKPTDKTLSIPNAVADAAATGEAIANTVNVTNETSVTDSVDGVLKINKLYGKSEQFTTSGAQLIDTDAFTSAIEATFAVNNNVITVTGIKSYAGVRYIIPNPTSYAGKYLTLSCKSISKSSANEGHCIAQLAIQKVEGATEYFSINSSRLVNTFKIPEDVSIITLQIMVNNSTVSLSANNTVTVVDLMLNLGEAALPWEPYTGGKATPNPDYPQEIESAGDSGEVDGTVYSGNLLSFDEIYSKLGTNSEITQTYANGKLTMSGTPTAAYRQNTTGRTGLALPKYITGKKLYFGATLSGNQPYMVLYLRDASGAQLEGGCGLTASGVKEVNVPENAAYMEFAFCLNMGTTGTAYTATYSDLYLSSTNDGYKEYADPKSLSIPTPNGLPGIKVTDASLANHTDPDGNMWVCDEIDFERGVYIKRIGRLVIDKSYTYYYDSTNGFHYTADGTISNVSSWETRIVSTHFCRIGNGVGMGDYGWMQFSGGGGFRVKIEGLTTLESLAEWLDSNTPEVIYPLATPIETPLTREQMLAIRDLSSHDGGTNILFDSVEPGVELEYPRTLAASYILENQKDLAVLNDPIRSVVAESMTTIDDSAAGGLKLNKVYGKSVQETLTGKNLLKTTATTQTVNGVTFTVNDDGSITANGTATSGTSINVGVNTLTTGQSYVLSGCPEGGATNIYYMYRQYNSGDYYAFDTGDGITFTEEYGGELKVWIVILSGVTVSNLTFKPMIRLASIEDDTFEPYCGGIPSPNPDYPQEIESASGDFKTVGKNLFDISRDNIFKNNGSTITNKVITDTGAKFTVDVSSGSVAAGIYTKVGDNPLIVVGETHTISCDVKVSAVDSFTNFRLSMSGAGVGALYNASEFTAGVFKHCVFSVAATSDSITLYFNVKDYTDGTDFDVEIANIQIEAGSVATDFEPYSETAVTFSTPNGLPAIPVSDASLATYTDENGQMWCADEIDVARGVYVKRVHAITFDTATGLTKAYSGDDIYVYYKPLPSGYPCGCGTVSLCDRLVHSSTLLKNGGGNTKDALMVSPSATYDVVYFNIGYYVTENTVEAVGTYLAEHPLTVQYILETPIETPLTNDEIIAAHSLKTYDGVTHIIPDSNPAPTVEFEYGVTEVAALSLENSNLHAINEVMRGQYLPLSGGNITGNLQVGGKPVITDGSGNSGTTIMAVSDFNSAYGADSTPAVWGSIVIQGASRPGKYSGDTYYNIFATSNGKCYTGYQINGATTITWLAQLTSADFTVSGDTLILEWL